MRTSWAAWTAAAGCEACRETSERRTGYGLKNPSMLLTASKMAAQRMTKLRVE